jgi:hypothetical protein
MAHRDSVLRGLLQTVFRGARLESESDTILLLFCSVQEVTCFVQAYIKHLRSEFHVTDI